MNIWRTRNDRLSWVNAIVKKPEIITSEIGRDFGFGLKNRQKDGALISARKNANAKAILNVYEYNKEAAEKALNICNRLPLGRRF